VLVKILPLSSVVRIGLTGKVTSAKREGAYPSKHLGWEFPAMGPPVQRPWCGFENSKEATG
jgi:hypothetical protein